MILRKFTTILVSILLLSFIAGMYGVVHDFITYKISPEYFTKFKFIQFGLIEPGKNLPINSLQLLAVTGWASTWWVGCIAGSIFSGIAFRFKNTTDIATSMAKAAFIMICTAIVFGILGYNIGFFSETLGLPDLAQACYECDTINNPSAFNTVGYIHNFSYIGGFIGIILGAVSILKFKHKIAVEQVLKDNVK